MTNLQDNFLVKTKKGNEYYEHGLVHAVIMCEHGLGHAAAFSTRNGRNDYKLI